MLLRLILAAFVLMLMSMPLVQTAFALAINSRFSFCLYF